MLQKKKVFIFILEYFSFLFTLHSIAMNMKGDTKMRGTSTTLFSNSNKALIFN